MEKQKTCKKESVQTGQEKNFDQLGDRARQLFLKIDQSVIMSRLPVRADDAWFYVTYLNTPLKVSRTDGTVRNPDGTPVETMTAMIVYDMLAHSSEKPVLSGRFVTLTSLGGHIAAGHLMGLKNTIPERFFQGHTLELKEACRKLGGKEMDHGDVSYLLPLFDFFPVWMQFWDGDDEFPASLNFQWDASSLSFLHYETLWYVMEDIQARLAELL